MKVLIPCAGLATRWHGDTPKQLIKLLGEPLLHRTVRLVKEYAPDAQIHIVVKDLTDDRFKLPGTRRAVANLDPTRSQADKFLSSRHLWPKTDRVLILWGDVFYTRAAIQTLLSWDGDWAMFARLGPSTITGKDHRECVGWAVGPTGQQTVDEALQFCVDEARAGRLLNWSGSWQVYRAAHGMLYTPWADLPTDVLGNVVEVDDATDDFDAPSDWDSWCWRYSQFTPAERELHGMTR